MKHSFVENGQLINIHFFSYFNFTPIVFDLQRRSMYQNIAFVMGVLLVRSDFFESVYLRKCFEQKSSNFLLLGPYSRVPIRGHGAFIWHIPFIRPDTISKK